MLSLEEAIDKEMWRYTAIRREPRITRPPYRFFRGKPVVCEAFNLWTEGLIAEVRPSRDNKPSALMICLKYGISALCDECNDPSCDDRFWAMADCGGVLTKEDLEKIISRSKSPALYTGNYGIESCKQAMQLLGMIEELEAKQARRSS